MDNFYNGCDKNIVMFLQIPAPFKQEYSLLPGLGIGFDVRIPQSEFEDIFQDSNPGTEYGDVG